MAMPVFEIAGTNREVEQAIAAERERCAKICETEAAACMGDIVEGDDAGTTLACARAGCLIDAAKDIRKGE